MLQRIEVVAGILKRRDGRLLICSRPPGRHMAGFFEFPGGKREAGESARVTLARELWEELGIEVRDAHRYLQLRFAYPDRLVALDFYFVTRWHGIPRPHDAQLLRWVTPAELPAEKLLPADRPVAVGLQVGCVLPVKRLRPIAGARTLQRLPVAGGQLVVELRAGFGSRPTERRTELILQSCNGGRRPRFALQRQLRRLRHPVYLQGPGMTPGRAQVLRAAGVAGAAQPRWRLSTGTPGAGRFSRTIRGGR